LNPESIHRVCWYSRRTAILPADLRFQTIEDGQVLFCAHPMWFPVVAYDFDVRNCAACDYFRPMRTTFQTVVMPLRTSPGT
jgi:hypothetical protein